MAKFLEVISGYDLSGSSSIGRTLADCERIASLFDNTCSSTSEPIDWSSHVGETMSCTGQMMCPGGDGSEFYTTENPCQFERKLCVTCEEDGSDVYVRFQTNQMPDHCFQAINENPEIKDTEWKVKFNRDVSGMLNYEESDVDTQAEVEELLCDIQRTSDSNMLSGSGYEEVSVNNGRRLQPPGPPSVLTTAGAIARSGALIFNAMAAGNMDAVENEWVTLDECLTHPTPTKNYHYHMFSPCYKRGNGYASTTVAPNMCKDDMNCH
jgi:hypothetical protein